MASMQILGGSPSSGAAAGGAPGGLDPLMAGFGAEGAAVGSGADGAATENPFASELAAALASLEGSAAQPTADALAKQIVVDAAATAQIAAEGALALGSGQNLPLDPAFQNAVLATFAAVNTAVQTDAAAAQALAISAAADAKLAADAELAAQVASFLNMTDEQKAMLTEQELAAMNLAAQTLAAQAASAQLASDQVQTLAQGVEQSLAANKPQVQIDAPVIEGPMPQDVALANLASLTPELTAEEGATQEVVVDVALGTQQVTADQSASEMTGAMTNLVTQTLNTTSTSTVAAINQDPAVQSAAAAAATAMALSANAQAAQDKNTQASAKPVTVDANQVVNTDQAASDSAVATGDAVLDIAVNEKTQVQRAPVAQTHMATGDPAKNTDAARVAVSVEADKAPAQQVVVGNQQVTDIGNVLVTAKANADGIAAAGDAARQSAQRIDGATGVSASQSAEAAAARAESRLEAARASLGSGPLNVEVLKLTRQGGGRAVLEVTPPNQGPIRLDLQLDGAGRASLIVEGLTESMKARLESSAHFLRQDMAQMGLALNLEMRERNDSNASAQSFAQGFGQSGQGSNSRSSSAQSGSATTGQDIGNLPGQRKSNVVEDGVHLVA